MTMIKLGIGGDAIEVEDGASVPLMNAGGLRGTIHMVAGLPCLRWGVNGQAVCSIRPDSGRVDGTWVMAIDLPALRRERAPKVETVGCWGISVPKFSGHYTTIYSFQTPTDKYPDYWTHRPGNTPEKQAAFDAAIAELVNDHWNDADVMAPETTAGQFVKAARALGYGKK